MSSPLWPTALSPVAIRTRSRNSSFQRGDSSSPWPSSAPHYPSLCTQSQQIWPALCLELLWGSYCRELLYKYCQKLPPQGFHCWEALSMSIRVKAGSWRLCVSFLLCCRETRSAGVLAALSPALGEILQIQGWDKSILWATEFIPLLHLNFHLRLNYKMKEISLSFLMMKKRKWLMSV